MEKKTQRYTAAGRRLLSFALPAALLTAAFAWMGITPFGDRSLLVSDMNGQYTAFFAYLKALPASGNGLLYTFSKTLGGDMLGIFAYYLLSPLNLLVLLFPYRSLPTAVSCLAVLKVGLAGLSCFCTWTDGKQKGGTIFSTAYALSAYNLAYLINPMWLDSVILLPVLARTIRTLVRGPSRTLLYRPYILTLALALAVNYYIGYMLCVFSVGFFLYLLLLEKSPRFRALCSFFFSSLAAGGLAAVVLLPAFLTHRGGDAGLDLSQFAPRFYPLPQLLAERFFPFTFSYGVVNEPWPNLFCGCVIFALALLYFLNPGLSRKERGLSALGLGFYLLSFSFVPLDLVWHVFNPPACFPSRYSFQFCFALVCLAWRGFTHRDSLTAARCRLAVLLTACFAVAVLPGSVRVGTRAAAYFLVLCAAAIFCARRSAVPLALLALLSAGDLTLSAVDTLAGYLPYSGGAAEYAAYDDRLRPVVRQFAGEGEEFWRIEVTFPRCYENGITERSRNVPMQFSYMGLSHYSSCEKVAVKDFQGKLGFRNHGHWAYYGDGSTTAADCLLGVRYLMAEQPLEKPYQTEAEKEGILVYRNPLALPIGVLGREDAELGDDPFENQNRMLGALLGRPAAVYLRENEEQTDTDGTWFVTMSGSGPLYACLTGPVPQEAELFVNGVSRGPYLDVFHGGAVLLGNFRQGETVRVELRAEVDEALFYREDTVLLQRCCEELQGGSAGLQKRSGSRLEGRFTAQDGQYLAVQIPWEASWHCLVDGKPAATEPVFGMLLGIPLPEGEHTVALYYLPQGLLVGAILSLFTLLLLLPKKNLKSLLTRRGGRGTLGE